MSPRPLNSQASLLRADMLLRQGRFQEAEQYLVESLAANPTDGEILHTLAIAQLHQEQRAKTALKTIENALAQNPAQPVYHATKARILVALDKPAQALAAADDAIRLEPANTYAFTARTSALLAMEKWPEAEASARHALALDPTDTLAANQLATALRLQGRTTENVAQISGMLAQDPLNPFTHASAGWNALQMGERALAEKHFLEALRLDPEMEYARKGMLEAFRARSAFYRMYLNYAFWMLRMPSRTRLVLIVSAYFLFRLVSKLARETGNVLLYVVVFLYILFALWTHYAIPTGNLIVLSDRWARHALRPLEKLEALLVGGGVVAAVPLLILGFAFDDLAIMGAGVTLIAAAMPLRYTLTNKQPWGILLFGGATLYFLAVGLLFVFSTRLPAAVTRDLPNYLALGILLFLAVQLLPGISKLYQPR